MSSTIDFFLDGKLQRIEVDDANGPRPTTTVLQYLRALPGHTGTKEGCAEGDCGACTVVVGEPDTNGDMQYKAVDSCLVFLPMLHGKQLITVENLKSPEGALHPVQQAMVDSHGSQCGYCTPGFVMSMVALAKNSPNATRAQIDDALTGNLCRCTGYRPIIEATAAASAQRNSNHLPELDPQSQKQLHALSRDSIQLSTSRQEYLRPASLAEALKLKRQHPQAVVINGATDIALRVTKRHEILERIIDLSGVEEIAGTKDDENELTLGAGLSLERVKQVVEKEFPALYNMLVVFGSLQIRNLATLGGNLGSASPIGDTLPVLMAYRARVVLQNETGKREVAMDQYITGYRQTVRAPDELIVAVTLPKISNSAVVRSYKVSKRKDLDISTVSGAFRLERSAQGMVDSIILAFGGMAERTKRATKTEAFLAGKPWMRTIIDGAMQILSSEFTPISDARSGAEFRTVAAGNLLVKFWSESHTL